MTTLPECVSSRIYHCLLIAPHIFWFVIRLIHADVQPNGAGDSNRATPSMTTQQPERVGMPTRAVVMH